jgi:hypothetical protein
MKKNEIKKIALMGLTTGFLISSQLHGAVLDKEKTDKSVKPATDLDLNEGNAGYHLMTEDELLLELNNQGAALYKSLDPKGKELARFVASQRCNGTNACKGLNACQTDKNDCAGKGECKGKGKCAISDKNLAVKIVADKLKMADKRGNLTH